MLKCLFVAVDYFSTATYYWPNIVENATQIEDTLGSGTDTYEPTPDNGPFGFGAVLKLDGTEANINLIWSHKTTIFADSNISAVPH